MTTLRKAAQHALEALRNPWAAGPEGVADAITALRQALEQPAQQELPAWWPAVENILKEYGLQAIDFVADFKAALAKQPAQRKPLQDEEIIRWVESGEYNVITNDWSSHIDFARAIEQAHGIIP